MRSILQLGQITDPRKAFRLLKSSYECYFIIEYFGGCLSGPFQFKVLIRLRHSGPNFIACTRLNKLK